MAGELWLGIDLGTTVLKVGVFEGRNGHCVGQSGRRLPVKALPDGGRELTPAAIDRAFLEVIKDVKGQLGNRWPRVCGIGLAAQGGSSVIANRLSGQTYTTMYLWNDARARSWVSRLAEQADRAFWRRIFLFDMPPTGLGRLCWLKERFGDLFRDDNIHVGAGEFLFHRLTGIWRQDAGNAIQVGSYNAKMLRLDGKALEMADVPLSFVAPLRRGHETSPLSKDAARLLEVPSGIPVAGPYIDQEGCYMSATAAFKRPLQCSLGTAWVGNFALAPGTRGQSPSQLLLPEPSGKGHLVVQPLYAGNTSWDWALTAFVDHDLGRALAQSARIFSKQMLPPQGLVGIPWCDQQNPVNAEAHGAGVFVGANTHTTPYDLVRATASGLVFELFRMFESAKECGAMDGIVLGGGASKGTCFRRLVTAMFHPLPVWWQKDYDLAAARGVVMPLCPEAARGAFITIKAENVPLDALQESYKMYLAAFARLFGRNPELRPFRCRGR